MLLSSHLLKTTLITHKGFNLCLLLEAILYRYLSFEGTFSVSKDTYMHIYYYY